MRATGHYESPYPLATLPRMDKNSIHHPHRPHQPTILESPTEAKPTNGMVARRPPRIRLCHQTYPWQDQHASRRTITPTEFRPRRRQQQGSNPPRIKTLHKRYRHANPRLLKKKPYGSHSRPPHRRTPRTRRNDPKGYGNPTMDRNATMDHRLRKRLRHMPTK